MQVNRKYELKPCFMKQVIMREAIQIILHLSFLNDHFCANRQHII